MTNHKAIHIFNNLSPMTVGFDSVFTSFEALLDLTDNGSRVPNFPPYNIVKTGMFTYDIELALAGYSKSDVSVDYADSVLTVKSLHKREELKPFHKDDDMEDGEEQPDFLHKGIAKRHFNRSFTIADDVEVKGAELKDGLLKVSLEKIVPDSKKPRTIKIK